MPDELDAVEEAVGTDRRTFIKRLVIGTAFAAPIVSSFTMSGVGAVFGTSLGASTMMAPNASEPPAPSMYTKRICTPYNGGNLGTGQPGVVGFASVTAIANPNSGGVLPNGSTVCLYEGDLVALAALFPTGQVPVSAWAVKWNVLSGSPTATVPVNLTVTTVPVLTGDPIYAVDSGSPVNVGTVGADGTWSQSFVNDPAFVVTHGSPTPDTPPASGGEGVPGESTAGASTGTAGAAAAVDAAPSTTG